MNGGATRTAAPRSITWMIVTVIVLAGTLVQLHQLGSWSFDGSEISQVNSAAGPLQVLPRAQASTAATGLSVPVLITRFALRWGYGEFALRLPSVLAGAAAAVALWLLGVATVGHEAALYATVLLVFSARQVGFSQQVGSEVWLSLFALSTVLAFWWTRAVWEGQYSSRVSGRWLVFAVASTLLCLSSYAGTLVVAALAACLICASVAGRAKASTALVGLAAMLIAISAAVLCYVRNPPPPGGAWFPILLLPRLREVIEGLTPFDTLGGAGVALVGLSALAGAIWIAVRGGEGTILLSWAVIGVAGTVITGWARRAPFSPGQIAFVYPAYLLLVGAGLRLVRSLMARTSGRRLLLIQTSLVVGLVLVEVPALARYFRQPRMPWREAAAIVAANVRHDDVIVVLQERESFLFYAPDLQGRVKPMVPPALAPGYFARAKRAWLIAPAWLHVYPGWTRIEAWFKRFPPVDLSPSPELDVFYLGSEGREQLLLEAAFFELPTSTLVHGGFLFDVLRGVGVQSPVLWKVDQIALSRRPLNFLNPDLLNVVYYLAEHGYGDRAGSLAYRLATACPDWQVAREALAAFQPAKRPSGAFHKEGAYHKEGA